MPVLKKILHRCAPILCMVYGALFFSAQVSSREYQVKAVFLFNFTQFVEWPASAFPETNSPLVIGVLGEDPFGKYLDEAVAGEKANTHPLVIKRYSSITEVKSCHILFININETAQFKEAMASLKNQTILTVSDNSAFLKQGGIIRFFTKDDKIQFQINTEAAKNNNLSISSKLLRLAKIYDSGKN